MADVTDVADALVSLISAALYPNGTSQPSAANSLPCVIYQGWPQPKQLDADLGAATPKIHVSVYPRDEERYVEQFPNTASTVTVNAITLTATIASQQITIGGAVPSPTFYAHNVSILVNGKYYVYAVQASDTPTSIATALATLINADVAGTSNTGPVITLPAGARIAAARVGTIGTQYRELRRQERGFQVTVWANCHSSRNAVAKVIDVAIAQTQFLTLVDGYSGRLRYRSSPMSDDLEKSRIYRRDFMMTVEFATTVQIVATQVTQATETVTPTNSPATPMITINT